MLRVSDKNDVDDKSVNCVDSGSVVGNDVGRVGEFISRFFWRTVYSLIFCCSGGLGVVVKEDGGRGLCQSLVWL